MFERRGRTDDGVSSVCIYRDQRLMPSVDVYPPSLFISLSMETPVVSVLVDAVVVAVDADGARLYVIAVSGVVWRSCR